METSSIKSHLEAEGISDTEIDYEDEFSLASVTCFYNEEEIAEESVRSLENAAQKSDHYETIYVVDDGSEDNTAAILEEYAEDSDIIEFHEMEENTGKVGAQKKVIELIDEEYWLSIDADSYIENPEKIDEAIYELENSNSSFAMLNIEPENSEKDGLWSYWSKALEKMQQTEYNLRFGVDDWLSGAGESKILTASGTATLGKTDVIREGMEYHTEQYAGDDRQLTSILQHKLGENGEYIDDITINTDCPEELNNLYSQRRIWANGRINAVSALPREHLNALKEGDRYSMVLGADVLMASSTPVTAYSAANSLSTGEPETLALGYGTSLALAGGLYANARARDQIGDADNKLEHLKESVKDSPKIAFMPLYQSVVSAPTILGSFKDKFIDEPIEEFWAGYREGQEKVGGEQVLTQSRTSPVKNQIPGD